MDHHAWEFLMLSPAFFFDLSALLTLKSAYIVAVLDAFPFSLYFLVVVSLAWGESLLVKGFGFFPIFKANWDASSMS